MCRGHLCAFVCDRYEFDYEESGPLALEREQVPIEFAVKVRKKR